MKSKGDGSDCSATSNPSEVRAVGEQSLSGPERDDQEFRREVASAICEADDPKTEWVSNQKVDELSRLRRKAWREKGNGQQ